MPSAWKWPSSRWPIYPPPGSSFSGDCFANLYEQEQCCAIIRGLRAVSDFEYEFQMALMNRKQLRRAETVFLMPSLRWVYLSSNLIKEVARHNGAIKDLVPEIVYRKLKDAFGNK